MLTFSVAQTFFLDKETVKGAAEVAITSIDLFVKFKPHAYNNKSGIAFPGITLMLCETVDSIPDVRKIIPNVVARREYYDILGSSDSSIPTRFSFSSPINVRTDKEYAILIKYDGNEDYVLWVSKQGDLLVGTTSISPGPSGKYVGKYFEFDVPFSHSISDTFDSESASNSEIMIRTDANNLEYQPPAYFRPINDMDLKFLVNVARYAVDGIPVDSAVLSSNTVILRDLGVTATSTAKPFHEFSIPFKPMEYMTYEKRSSSANVVGVSGAKVYQNTVYYPGGWANGASAISISVSANSRLVTANTRYSNGSLFNWTDVFDFGAAEEYLTIISLLHTGSDRKTNIRKVLEAQSNTVLVLDEAVTFSNTGAYFCLSPVGRVASISETNLFDGREDVIYLRDTNANASVRFVNNAIESVTITAGGTGYSNSDILHVNGFENVDVEVEGGYKATANLVTNSTGGITAVYFSNVGAGFVNSAAITAVLANSSSGNITSNTSAGAGATLTMVVNSTIRSELHGNDEYFRNAIVKNIPVGIVRPTMNINAPPGTSHALYHQSFTYELISGNTISGKKSMAMDSPLTTRREVKNQQHNPIETTNTSIIPSRSNEFIINYANSLYNVVIDPAAPTSNTVRLFLTTTSNNDFVAVSVERNPALSYGAYYINNDYTGENTDQGNAAAKHITTKINFADDKSVEDLRVYMTAYRPSGTDIKLFARIHNRLDTEDEFDDKDWTLLELKDGSANLFSSQSDKNNYVELTYGLSLFPNSAFTFTGAVSTTNASAAIVGSGTTFNDGTNNVVANDLVKIYQPLFPNNYVIGVVNSVTNATHLTLKSALSNNSILGNGLKIDKIAYPKQAFNNILNDNVVRYYSESLSEFDTFDTVALKIVMISNSQSVIPRVDDVKLVGVSA